MKVGANPTHDAYAASWKDRVPAGRVLAEGLKTGVTEWPETLETKSAVELVQELLHELENKLDGVNNSSSKKEAEKVKSDTAAVDSSIQSFITERGDLDFAEMLWCKMRRSVSSYQDVQDCFSLVIQSLKYGDVHPWIHRGSSSTLSKLIQQSYHGNMQSISLSGLAPIRMLLEIGLDKMKKDYINCFIGRELATFNYLDYFISTSVDLQEQVHRVRKLHHMLEVVVNCNAFLSLEHENLFPLTQSCLKYYKENPWNEQHVFRLPIRPSVISSFYQNSHPQTWRVEILSGHGQKEVKTMWQLSARPPVDHVSFDVPDVQNDMAMSGDSEDILYYQSQISCSQVHFLRIIKSTALMRMHRVQTVGTTISVTISMWLVSGSRMRKFHNMNIKVLDGLALQAFVVIFIRNSRLLCDLHVKHPNKCITMTFPPVITLFCMIGGEGILDQDGDRHRIFTDNQDGQYHSLTCLYRV
ncbi:unnamed protein product [Ranitomeya imitator]|uniref:Protein zwilch n=1 Tax=Ranitomeya imitator TaxID=111125 RepID=A0ABN9L736_9NEOB|nr:unnamed protein product [Ranitomeya imitator]